MFQAPGMAPCLLFKVWGGWSHRHHLSQGGLIPTDIEPWFALSLPEVLSQFSVKSAETDPEMSTAKPLKCHKGSPSTVLPGSQPACRSSVTGHSPCLPMVAAWGIGRHALRLIQGGMVGGFFQQHPCSWMPKLRSSSFFCCWLKVIF